MFKILNAHVMPQTLIIMPLKSCTRRIQPKLSHRTAAAKRGIASMQSVDCLKNKEYGIYPHLTYGITSWGSVCKTRL